MASVRGRDTGIEMTLKRLLRGYGFAYQPKFMGNPDFLHRKAKIAVFVDGCFWHGCPRCYTKPKTHAGFWMAKVKRNRANDKKVTRELRKKGFRTIRIWGHSIKKNPERAAERVVRYLQRNV